MGYAGKLKEKQDAIKLRERGFSYAQIQKQVHVSKGTLSQWCRNVILSTSQLEKLLERKLVGGEKGRIIGAKVLQTKRIIETKKLLDKGKHEVGKLSKREKFLLGIALYVAEGAKTDRQIGFSNSDPKLIKFMMNWFIDFCKLNREKIRARIWIHSNRNESDAKVFWSKLTALPLRRFGKSYIAENKINSRKIRKQIHPNGILGITTTNAKVHRKIMGWIAGAFGS